MTNLVQHLCEHLLSLYFQVGHIYQLKTETTCPQECYKPQTVDNIRKRLQSKFNDNSQWHQSRKDCLSLWYIYLCS